MNSKIKSTFPTPYPKTYLCMAGTLLIASLLVLLTACGPKSNTPTDLAIVVNPTEEKLDIKDFASDFEAIALETNENCLVGGDVRKLLIHDNKFYIWEQQTDKVWVFNDDGTFSHSVGKKGRGPGEHTGITDFTIDKKMNRVVILSSGIVYVYKLDGSFITQKQISQIFFKNIAYHNGSFVCSIMQKLNETDHLFYFFDSDFNPRESVFSDLPAWSLSWSHFCEQDDRVVYVDIVNNYLYEIHFENPAATIRRPIVFPKPIPQEMLADNRRLFSSERSGYDYILSYAALVDDLFILPFVSDSRPYMFFLNLNDGRQAAPLEDSWFPSIYRASGGYCYSVMQASSLLDRLDRKEGFACKNISRFKIEQESNPVVLRFKLINFKPPIKQ